MVYITRKSVFGMHFGCDTCSSERNIVWASNADALFHVVSEHHLDERKAQGEVVRILTEDYCTVGCDVCEALIGPNKVRYMHRDDALEHLVEHLNGVHGVGRARARLEINNALPVTAKEVDDRVRGIPKGAPKPGVGPDKAPAAFKDKLKQDARAYAASCAASVLKSVPNAVPPIEGNGCKRKSLFWLKRTLAASADMNPIDKAEYFDKEYIQIVQEQPPMAKYILEILQTDEDKWASVRTEFARARAVLKAFD